MKSRKHSRFWLLSVALAVVLCVWLLPNSTARAERETNIALSAAREDSRESRRETDADPYLVEEKSFFSDFTIRGDRVYFLCSLCVENPGEELRAATITGDFLADAEGGLLETTDGQVPVRRVLGALRLDGYRAGSFLELSDAELAAAVDRRGRWGEAPDLFLLQPGENTFWVIFSAEQGEAAQKQDRLLPPISICPLRDVSSEEIRTETGCRIFTEDAFGGLFYLVDGERGSELGISFGGYGLCSAVPWDYDENGTVDLLYTYSWGSGMHRSILALFDRTKWEGQELYGYFPDSDSPGSDLLVERETDEGGAPAYTVYIVDVQMQGYDPIGLRFTKKEEAGMVSAIWNPVKPELQPLFWPASADFFRLAEDASVTRPPVACDFSIADLSFSFTGEKAAELLDFCEEARKQAEFADTFEQARTKPLLKLIFTWDDGSLVYYQIDGNDKCLFGLGDVNTQAALQLPAGTYEKLLAALEEAEGGKAP